MKRKNYLKLSCITMAIFMVVCLFVPAFSVRADEDIAPAYYVDEEGEDYTGEELEYIKQSKVLKVGYVADNAPISYKDKETGELAGISRAIFDKISKISGLRFEYVALPEGTVRYEYLVQNKFDLVTGVEHNQINLSLEVMQLSEPYLSSNRVIVCKDGFEFNPEGNYSVAIATGSATYKDVLEPQYPNFEIVTYNTVEESFEAVYDGKQDMVLVNRYVASYWMAKPKYGDLSIVPVDDIRDDLCFATIIEIDNEGNLVNDDSALIISIINKTLNKISQAEIDSLIIKETMENQYKYSLADFVYLYRYVFGIIFVFIIIIVIILTSVSNLKKRHKAQKKEEERNLILQQKRYKMIIDNSEELIYEISLFGEPCIASERIKDKFGWSIPRQVENLSIRTLGEILHIHPDDEEQFYSSTEGLVANKEVKELLIRLGKADMTYIWCKVIYLPIIDDDGNMVSIVGKIIDVDDTVREKEQLEYKSRTDSLTGLLNKKTFEDETRQYIEENTAVSSAFIFIDMDFFKNVNDLLGHVMGDQVIKDTAVKLQVIFANCDLVARFGGDEYCIFVKDIPSETLADKLNFAVDKLSDVYTNNGIRVCLTASIGAAYCSSPSVGYDQLLDCADKAVYRAKQEGRNRFLITYM